MLRRNNEQLHRHVYELQTELRRLERDNASLCTQVSTSKLYLGDPLAKHVTAAAPTPAATAEAATTLADTTPTLADTAPLQPDADKETKT